MPKKYSQAKIERVLTLLNEGKTRKEVAKVTGINMHTVDYYASKRSNPTKRAIRPTAAFPATTDTTSPSFIDAVADRVASRISLRLTQDLQGIFERVFK